MENSQMIKQENSVLRWGGLSGIIGGILFILSLVVAMVLIPAAPANLTELVARFPDVHILRVAENGLYLFGLILGVPLFSWLYSGQSRKRVSHLLSLAVLWALWVLFRWQFQRHRMSHISLFQNFINRQV